MFDFVPKSYLVLTCLAGQPLERLCNALNISVYTFVVCVISTYTTVLQNNFTKPKKVLFDYVYILLATKENFHTPSSILYVHVFYGPYLKIHPRLLKSDLEYQ